MSSPPAQIVHIERLAESIAEIMLVSKVTEYFVVFLLLLCRRIVDLQWKKLQRR